MITQNHKKGSLNRQTPEYYSTENGRKTVKSPKYPIFLSAAVYPGAGQLSQRRWLAGIFFIISFTVSFIAFVIIMGTIIVNFYSLGFDFANAHVSTNPPIRDALSSFALAMLIYIINILDVHIANG